MHGLSLWDALTGRLFYGLSKVGIQEWAFLRGCIPISPLSGDKLEDSGII